MTMSLIQTVTVGSGGASIINFTSIPQDGTDLILILSARRSAIGFGSAGIRFNGDTTFGNHTSRILTGNGETAASLTGSGDNIVFFDVIPGSDSTSNTFGNLQYYIPNYTSANSKIVSGDGVSENNATTSYQVLGAGRWVGTTAITSLVIGFTFAENTTASLYKITKGSDGTTVVS